jgi:hypothetical protein
VSKKDELIHAIQKEISELVSWLLAGRGDDA